SALVQQWIDIHQVDEAGAALDEVDGQPRMSWRDASGDIVVEHYAIDGMAHGVPIDAKLRGSSVPLAPFILDAGISSTFHIAKSWGPLRQTAGGHSPVLRVQWQRWFADHALEPGPHQKSREHVRAAF
ncbi:MAG: hypothetical protein ACREDA_10110, partial [Methylocella sp.]